jgi:hypothetical protein
MRQLKNMERQIKYKCVNWKIMKPKIKYKCASTEKYGAIKSSNSIAQLKNIEESNKVWMRQQIFDFMAQLKYIETSNIIVKEKNT